MVRKKRTRDELKKAIFERQINAEFAHLKKYDSIGCIQKLLHTLENFPADTDNNKVISYYLKENTTTFIEVLRTHFEIIRLYFTKGRKGKHFDAIIDSNTQIIFSNTFYYIQILLLHHDKIVIENHFRDTLRRAEFQVVNIVNYFELKNRPLIKVK